MINLLFYKVKKGGGAMQKEVDEFNRKYTYTVPQ